MWILDAALMSSREITNRDGWQERVKGIGAMIQLDDDNDDNTKQKPGNYATRVFDLQKGKTPHQQVTWI